MEMDYREFDHKTKHEQRKKVLDEYFYSKKLPQDHHHNDKQNDPVRDY